MQCPKCQFENREEAKFCNKCGYKFDLTCPECGQIDPPESKFCSECGCNLESVKAASNAISDTESLPHPPSSEKPTRDIAPSVGERKHVTVLFSDLTGYTAMSEKLDPEEVKEITSGIFSGISKIVAGYDGFIEKYAGDAVMAIFGVPQAHEDDPVRAVKAAREIHQLVDTISPEVEKRIGQSISMHTGINTGLVVTGEVDMERGTHGIAGDTINLASRLSNMAKSGEILVNADTCRQIEGQFACEYIETTTVKGKADSVEVHQVISQRDKPVTIHRLSGMRADLVGRDVEMAELSAAVDNLRQGTGRIFSICGAAGTGKSRLVEEFKAGLDLDQIQWIEGHAYAYSQDIPYFPLVDLLNRFLHIEENDSTEKVREKVESELQSLVGNQEDIIPYVGGLYSLSYPETNDVSPEFWKSRLQAAILAILTALADKAPTIFFLEDLHWADPSFVELLRRACLKIRQPAIVLCAYRPTFSLFTGHQVSNIGKNYHDIQLQNLSLSVAQNMLASLLKTETIPPDLKRWVQSKAEGNPFYLEELVNSLIESDTLARDNGSWKLTRSLAESDIPSSLHGLITGRLDRLDQQTKRILQKASVIGRDFLYEILKRITELEERIDGELSQLERLDLIRTRSLHPDIEYMFKHALTQEIVYNGLLKKQRREIHEHIAQVMESVFKDRLAEFNETLAYHFARGQSVIKAVDYLVKSGEKSLKRYALEESHQYYNEAFILLTEISNKTESDKELLIDLLIKWALVFYYRGAFRELDDLLEHHKEMAASLEDKSKFGMLHAWHGFVLMCRNSIKDSYEYLKQALQVGEQVQDDRLIGYVCTWLPWTCFYFGRFDEAIEFGQRAQKISRRYPADQYLYFKSLGGMGCTYYWKGEKKKVFQIGNELVDFGRKNANIRSQSMGQAIIGLAYALEGNLTEAIENIKKAIRIAADPFYKEYERTFLAGFFALNGQMEDARQACRQIFKFHEHLGAEIVEASTLGFAGVAQIADGQMDAGLSLLKAGRRALREREAISTYCLCEYVMGKVYLQMTAKTEPLNFLTLAKNIGFIIKNLPFAAQKAEKHLTKAIECAEKIGAKSVSGPAYFDLGLFYRSKKKDDRAKECISEAIKIFKECEAEVYLKQANEALDSLE